MRLAVKQLRFGAVLAGAVMWGMAAWAQGLPQTTPAKVGFSAERLERVDQALQQVVDSGDYAGIAFAAARHGKLFYQYQAGARDLAAAKPITRDTLYRIYSMTKPVTGVALMMLYEEGKWRLDDPIAQHIPAFAELMVHDGVDADGQAVLVKPARAMTMRDLMRHTAGFSYGYFSDTPVDRLYQEDHPLNAATLPAMIDRLAQLPLLFQPGAAWHYSVAVDVQGHIVEKLSGQSLPEFFRDRIFKPLGMTDTDFHVPAAAQDRFAALYIMDAEAKALKPVASGQFGARDYREPPTMPSGGAGLVSSLGDYLRFAQMLLNGGALDGARLLSPRTVALMAADHLPEDLGPPPGWGLDPGLGFGLDFAVITDPVKAGTLASTGTYFWGGAAGTWFWVDPAADLIAVGMVQRLGEKPNMHRATATALYQALIDAER